MSRIVYQRIGAWVLVADVYNVDEDLQVVDDLRAKPLRERVVRLLGYALLCATAVRQRMTFTGNGEQRVCE